MRLRSIETKKMQRQLLFKKIGECSKSNGSLTTRGEPVKKYNEFGEGILAVANLCFKSKQNSNTNKASFSMNKLKSSRNIIEVFTAGNTSMISTLGRVTSTTFRLKTRR